VPEVAESIPSYDGHFASKRSEIRDGYSNAIKIPTVKFGRNFNFRRIKI